MSFAVAQGIPVLTAVRPANAAQWIEFSGNMGCDLPMDRTVVLDWVTAQLALKKVA